MSFWKRWFGRHEDGTADAEPAPPVPTASEEATVAARARRDAAERRSSKAEEQRRQRLERLRRVGQPQGADLAEAIAALRGSTGQAEQTAILEAVLEGLGHVPAGLDPLRVACATLLEEQGQRTRALTLVEPCRSVEGMMLAAELHASAGQLARAVGMVERVLARAIDTPGARERHAQWNAQLGRSAAKPTIDDGATVVAPQLSATASSYRLVREVARGGAGTVYLAEDALLGRPLAYKVYHRPHDDRAQLEREARTAVRLAGRGIARLYDVDPEAGWIASEWLEHGSLRQWLVAGRAQELLPLEGWLPALVHAVARVHDEGMVHGDLKPANVLFRAPGVPVLADFGLCAPPGRTDALGTPGYLAPERLEGGVSDFRDDVYAIGRIVEDVLGACDDAAIAIDPAVSERWTAFAVACLAPAGQRPAHARELVAALSAP